MYIRIVLFLVFHSSSCPLNFLFRVLTPRNWLWKCVRHRRRNKISAWEWSSVLGVSRRRNRVHRVNNFWLWVQHWWGRMWVRSPDNMVPVEKTQLWEEKSISIIVEITNFLNSAEKPLKMEVYCGNNFHSTHICTHIQDIHRNIHPTTSTLQSLRNSAS